MIHIRPLSILFEAFQEHRIADTVAFNGAMTACSNLEEASEMS